MMLRKANSYMMFGVDMLRALNSLKEVKLCGRKAAKRRAATQNSAFVER